MEWRRGVRVKRSSRVVEGVLGLGSAEQAVFVEKDVGRYCDLRKGHDLARRCVHQLCSPRGPMFLLSLWLEVTVPVDTSLGVNENLWTWAHWLQYCANDIVH